ncbi:MAG: isochorismatase family protein [Peptoniphilaceae bacterium]|nr:isochorismatase family protein [Peptoniphilaceae bacterium]MDD7383107.1 isochorismatase family protein [Peptoniphilaceae bacterium]MDY3737542.1 isochorismatase family protein [Peptoniphilaceae bacterium]
MNIKKDNTLLIVDLLKKSTTNEKINRNIESVLESSEIFNLKKILFEFEDKKNDSNFKDYKDYSFDKILKRKTINFFTEELKDYLFNNNIKNVILSLGYAHSSIFQTAREIILSGYNCFILNDAIFYENLRNKQVAVGEMRDMGCDIITCEMLIFDLLSSKENINFSRISSIIKNLRK